MVEDFKYLGATLSTKNDWAKGINIRPNKAKETFYALAIFLNSKILSKLTKTRPYNYAMSYVNATSAVNAVRCKRLLFKCIKIN